jgi:hypothetical protein
MPITEHNDIIDKKLNKVNETILKITIIINPNPALAQR